MAEAEIVEDVEASYLSAMQCKLDTWGKFKETKNFTIFRAPRGIDQTKKNLREPSVISIGPFHHGEMRFQAMEEKKWQFLRGFLSRGDHISLGLCISEMKRLEERTRRCYSETVDLDSHAFVEMMLLDGCFVLEYFLKEKHHRWSSSVLEFGWNSRSVFADLLVLENQISFFVVEKLCEIGVKDEDRNSFVKHLIRIMDPGPTNYPLTENPPTEIYHLVHLYHLCSVPNNPIEPVELRSKSFQLTRILNPCRIIYFLLGTLLWVLTRRFSSSRAFPTSTENTSMWMIPCASELQDAGIKFTQKRNPQHMLDISFVNGVLEIPRQFITCITMPLLTNLVALEQNRVDLMNRHLTSFLLFLNYLCNTQKDVMILEQCNIVHNILSSEEELTNYFNLVGDGLLYGSSHFLAEVFMEVNIYCESRWNKHRAKLVRDYFSSPWAALSLVAAVVLLILTLISTVFLCSLCLLCSPELMMPEHSLFHCTIY